MLGALQSLATPPAPDPSSQQGVLTGAMPGPMQQASPQPGGAPPQQQQPPAPDHAQTVAALRHFGAIGSLLQSALKDPDVGKADLKGKVIDGVTRLVADRMMPAADAVTELATFPNRPFDQKKWLEGHLATIMQARDAILSHHALAFAGSGSESTPASDNHMQDLASMMQSHYGARNG